MNRLTRIAVAGATGFAAVAGWMARAEAAPTTTFSFDSPSADGAVISQGPVTLAGRVGDPTGDITNVSVSVVWIDSRPMAQVPPPVSTSFPQAQKASVVPWSYSPPLPDNGHYSVTVTATSMIGPQSSASETFVQDIPPVAPVGLTDRVDFVTKSVALSWTANPEADLIGYEILRSGPAINSPFKVLYGVAAGTIAYTDSEVAKEPQGIYKYELVAVRANGTGGAHPDVSLPASAPSAAQFGTPPPPITPVVNSQAGGSGAGSNNAGSGSTGSGNGSTPSSGSGGGNVPQSNLVLPGVGSGLGSYQGLLGQAQQATATTLPPDVYSPNLPYQAQSGSKPITLPGDLGAGPLGTGSGTSTRTIEYVAGALLLVVLAGFGLVLRRAAEQGSVPLEAVAPSDTHFDVLPGEADGSSLLLTIYSQPEPLERLEPVERAERAEHEELELISA